MTLLLSLNISIQTIALGGVNKKEGANNLITKQKESYENKKLK